MNLHVRRLIGWSVCLNFFDRHGSYISNAPIGALVSGGDPLCVQVPYGCLVPPAVKNLLVAGRCVAGDKTSHCAMRNMMACTVTGQGAGVAAAVSIKAIYYYYSFIIIL